MSRKLKTREVTRDMKSLDKSLLAAQRMKNAYIKTKEQALPQKEQREAARLPHEVAASGVEDKGKRAAYQSARFVQQQGKKLYRMKQKKRGLRKAEQATAEAQWQEAGGQAVAAGRTAYADSAAAPYTAPKNNLAGKAGKHQYIRQRESSNVTIKQANKAAFTRMKQPSAATARRAGRDMKDARTVGKTAIKTGESAERFAETTAVQKMQGARRTSQMRTFAAEKARSGTKAAVKFLNSTLKGILAATRSMMAAVAGISSVVLAVVLLICMVGGLLSSSFGIFFSSESISDNLPTMSQLIVEINAEYEAKLEQIKAEHSGYEVEMSGSGAAWKEVLAIYAVKVNTDVENGQEVLSLEGNKPELLRSVFWDMNVINYRTETVTTTDDSGNATGSKSVLYITVSHKSIEAMMAEYGFTEEQQDMVLELLSPAYDSLWDSLLTGVGNIGGSGSGGNGGDILEVAISQIGNKGGRPYWSWFGYSQRVAWCACFVSWCANEVGDLDSGVIPRFSSCTAGMGWFKARDLWQPRGYVPSPGDIIFFSWSGGSVISNHVGIVEYVADGKVHTVEGNTRDSVARRSYSLNSRFVMGYGVPLY